MSSEINSVLKDEYADSLCDYQKNRINQIYREYTDLNRCACRHVIGHCPKCGAENPPLTKGGFTRNALLKPQVLFGFIPIKDLANGQTLSSVL